MRNFSTSYTKDRESGLGKAGGARGLCVRGRGGGEAAGVCVCVCVWQSVEWVSSFGSKATPGGGVNLVVCSSPHPVVGHPSYGAVIREGIQHKEFAFVTST